MAFSARNLRDLVILHSLTYLSRNRDQYPRYLIGAAAGLASLAILVTWITVTNPALGEIIQGAAAIAFQLGVAGVSCLMVWHMLSLFFVSSRNRWKDNLAEPLPQPKQIAATAWQVPDVSPDNLIYARNGETPEQFRERVEVAKDRTTPSSWVLVIPYRKNIAMVYPDPAHVGGYVFARQVGPAGFLDGYEPFLDTDFLNESPAEYCAYLDWFCARFRDWSTERKLSADPKRAVDTALEIVTKSAAAVCFFMLFSVSGFSQSKTRQVDEALGTRIREIPAPGANITFAFNEGGKDRYYYRTGDGRRTYVELLQKVQGLGSFNDEGGQLVAIQKDGKTIAQAEHVELVNLPRGGGNYITNPSQTGDPVRPNPLPTAGEVAAMPRTDQPVNYAIPDSATMAGMAERAKYQIWSMGQEAGRGVRPWWEVVMFTLWTCFPFLIVFGAISWFVAKVAAKEGMYDMHKWARYCFAVLALSVGSVLLINCLLFAVYAGVGPFGMTVIAIVETSIAYWVATKLIPDFRPAAGNAPRRSAAVQQYLPE